MKAILAEQPGGPEALALHELPDPVPGPGQARVRVDWAGVNYIDVYHRTGLYPTQHPIAVGREGAGLIEAVGPGVAFAPGTRVAWEGVPGSYATHVLAPVEKLVPLPDGLDSQLAAALMLQGMTAHYLTHSTVSLREGQVCLLHAAAGGTGLLVTQLAAQAGATVIGTVSSALKAERAHSAGCAHVIRYDQEDFVERVRELTGGRGVDVVYDSVGQATFTRSLDCLRTRGTMVLFGQSSGSVPPIDPGLLAKGSLYLTRPGLPHYVADRAELLERADFVLRAALAGTLTIVVDRVLPLAEAAQAHRLLESRATSGKLLLDTH